MRGVPRWLAVVAVLAVVGVVCAFTLHRALVPAAFTVHLSQSTIPADGFSSAELKIEATSGHSLRELHLDIDTPHQVTLEFLAVHGSKAELLLQSGVMPGDARIRLSAPGFKSQEITFRTVAENGDSIGDGTPDFLRLHDPADRQAFRRWFTLLAEAQYYRAKPQPEIDDCAALLRFAYREAMRQHDAAWARTIALPAAAAAGDIHQYNYPYTPLGADLFRVRDGAFTEADLRNGAFAQFADAESLWRHNTFLVGHAMDRARPGDLLFFRQDAGRMPFHAMIFLGRSHVEPTNAAFVVYHTGPDGNAKGIIKRLTVDELLTYPDARWRPVASNPVFLGVYRWNILRGGE